MTAPTAAAEAFFASHDFERTYVRYAVADGVGRLVLQRPPLNVLNIAMLEELEHVLGEMDREISEQDENGRVR